MTASRVRLVSVVWLLALLVIVIATWAAMTDPRAGTTWEEVVLVIAFGFGLTAALFQPIRRRVQAPIDRRFNRGHLDAERVVGSFAKRARDEVDLARLWEAVVGVVVEAVRPAGAAIWLRPEHPIVVYPSAAEGTWP